MTIFSIPYAKTKLEAEIDDKWSITLIEPHETPAPENPLLVVENALDKSTVF